MDKLKMKILIVDDDAASRESIRLALEEQEYIDIEVTESANATSGIQHAKRINPDVIILDLHMPNKNGWDFMNILHKDIYLAKTRVIMLTAYNTHDNAYKAEKKGIGEYQFLAKPFNIADLQALVLGLVPPIKK